MRGKRRRRRIGRYTITGILGHGGMGTVYRAVMPTTNRTVALKLLNPSEPLTALLGMPALRDIFSTEVLTMARLRHPHIADIRDFDYDGKNPFYTMEYYCANLGMMIDEKFTLESPTRRIPPDKVLAWGAQILDGLDCMHSAGVVHRDIKPQNMLVTDENTIKICDFGMSLDMEEGSGPSAPGMRVGTPYYAAPEQAADPDRADERSDLFSAGVLLYRLLTGELPVMKGFMLSLVNPLYDQGWDDFFARALSWKPERRFQNAAEMAAALMTLELHRQKHSRRICRDIAADQRPSSRHGLRDTPIRASGGRAGNLFGVDSLWQPRTYIRNMFAPPEEHIVLDEATRLLWQRAGSACPVDRPEAERLIAAWNGAGFGGITAWRLPTVNELLSLIPDPTLPESECGPAPFTGEREWFWSCDRRSRKTSWYVNTRLGYAGWQDDGCRYFVRAVASSPV
ncbi:MAG: protein kinase [Desulfobulbaceae bacterium]